MGCSPYSAPEPVSRGGESDCGPSAPLGRRVDGGFFVHAQDRVRKISAGGVSSVRPFRWCFLLSVMVLGLTVKGSQRWIDLGFFRFQPTEFVKITLVLVLAKHLCRYPPLDFSLFWGGSPYPRFQGSLYLFKPDAGSAMVYGVISFVAIIVAGAPWRYPAGLLALFTALLPFGWRFLREYQKMRIRVFLDPWIDPLGAGYNVIQSRIAVWFRRAVRRPIYGGAAKQAQVLAGTRIPTSSLASSRRNSVFYRCAGDALDSSPFCSGDSWTPGCTARTGGPRFLSPDFNLVLVSDAAKHRHEHGAPAHNGASPSARQLRRKFAAFVFRCARTCPERVRFDAERY